MRRGSASAVVHAESVCFKTPKSVRVRDGPELRHGALLAVAGGELIADDGVTVHAWGGAWSRSVRQEPALLPPSGSSHTLISRPQPPHNPSLHTVLFRGPPPPGVRSVHPCQCHRVGNTDRQTDRPTNTHTQKCHLVSNLNRARFWLHAGNHIEPEEYIRNRACFHARDSGLPKTSGAVWDGFENRHRSPGARET